MPKRDTFNKFLELGGTSEMESIFPYKLEELIDDKSIDYSKQQDLETLFNILEDKHNEFDVRIRFSAFYLILKYYTHPLKDEKYRDTVKKYEDVFKDFKYMKMLKANAISFGRTDEKSLNQALDLIAEAINEIKVSISFKHNYASLAITYCHHHGVNKKYMDKAKEYIKIVLDAKKNFALYYTTQASILELDGNYSEAYKEILKAINIEKDPNKKIEYTAQMNRIKLLDVSTKKLKELDEKMKEIESSTKKEVEKAIDGVAQEIEVLGNSKMDMIQTLGLFAAIIAFIVSGIVSVNSRSETTMDLVHTFFILMELCFVCVTIFSVFSMLFSKTKIQIRQYVLLGIGIIGLLMVLILLFVYYNISNNLVKL